MAVNHYRDALMESARRDLVRYVNYPSSDAQVKATLKEALLNAAAVLETRDDL